MLSIKSFSTLIMKKYLLITAVIFIYNYQLSAQNVIQHNVDSMKKVLATLKDSARVDCLNQIAQECRKWCEGWPLSTIARADSSYPYAMQANVEAKQLGYVKGIAYSFAQLGAGEQFRSNEYQYLGKAQVPQVLNKWEAYAKESIVWAEKLEDNNLLGQQYMALGEIFFRRNNFNAGAGNYKKAIAYFNLAGNEAAEAEVCTWLCDRYSGKGELEKGFEYCNRSTKLTQRIAQKNKDIDNEDYYNWLVQRSFTNMANLYNSAGDYEMSLSFFQKGKRYHKAGSAMTTDMSIDEGRVFQLLGNYDSSLYYLKKFETIHSLWTGGQNNIMGKIYLSETYRLTKNYSKALQVINECIDSLRNQQWNKLGNNYQLGKALTVAAGVHQDQKNYKKALACAQEGFLLMKNNEARPEIMNSYNLLSRIYHGLGNNDSAYSYLFKYITLKDSIQNKQFLFRLNSFKAMAEDEKKQGQIGLLSKDNKIKDQQLKQEGLIKKILIACLILLSLIVIFVFRTITLKRKNEKLQRLQVENDMKVQQLENDNRHAELQRRASELEMQALRAQMNPHFIFNCLSSINRFILKNETEAASDYLTRFSRLIRMVLVHSQEPLITLEDELEILRLYLDMEQLRFKDAFDYKIIFTNRVDTGSVFIPSLLLQPFCENAIWHGLMHKEKKGNLHIALSMEDHVLHCTITDDGIGRKMAAEMKSKSTQKDKSLGLKITQERLALLNGEKGIFTSYEISDIPDEDGNVAGTRVDLRIRYKESVENFI
jgi:sensor histidine kinase YesM